MVVTCQERERLTSEWTNSSNRLQNLLNEQLAALRNADPGYASFDEKVQLARTAETSASRAFYAHVDQHHCL